MEFKIDWHLGYANEPEIRLELEGPKPDWTNIVHQVCKLEEGIAAVAFDRGVAHFGIYRNLNGEQPLATRRGEYLVTVEHAGERRQIKFDGWSSSRASVMNVLFPESPTITDVWTVVKDHGYIGYATLDLIEQNVQHIPEGIWFLAAELIEQKHIEDSHISLLPSLSGDRFSLPPEKSWQEETLNTKYRIIRAYTRQED